MKKIKMISTKRETGSIQGHILCHRRVGNGKYEENSERQVAASDC
jgi:hypothetical protein